MKGIKNSKKEVKKGKKEQKMKGNVYFVSPIFLRGQGWNVKKEVELQKEAEKVYETHLSRSFSYEFSTHTPPVEFIPSLKTHSQDATPAPHLLEVKLRDFPLKPGHAYFIDVPENISMSMFGEIAWPLRFEIKANPPYYENIIVCSSKFINEVFKRNLFP